MIKLIDLQKYLNELLNFDNKLDINKIDPHMANGMMVKGREEIKKIGFGVSASLGLFQKAYETTCDALIVHHSFNLPFPNRYDKIFQDRMNFLLQKEISLFGFHFLLDAHPEIGNNAQIIKFLGAKTKKPFVFSGEPWGFIGEFHKETKIESIIEKTQGVFSPRSVYYSSGQKNIKKLAVVSGKGAPSPFMMQDLINEDIDLYITGEPHEWNRELFKEAGINFIAGGHYATEVFGLGALQEKVKQKFSGVETVWLDLFNEI